MSDYVPIDCALYSHYELTIMHAQVLRTAWRDPTGAVHLQTLLPVNLQTREHAEYLLARTREGGVVEIRLDHIIRAEPLNPVSQSKSAQE
jgi:Rho-binding antiterminator